MLRSKSFRNFAMILVIAPLFAILSTDIIAADDEIFSGPQVGEPLPSFQVRAVNTDRAGTKIDPLRDAAGKPMVLVFVHDINRQSISMTRILSAYTKTLTQKDLRTTVVFLQDDASEAERTYERIKHALTADVVTGVSIDGREGPGALGLNRNVTLTVLIAKDEKVVANYALVQPSLQVDLPKISKSIAETVGVEAPSLDSLLTAEPGMNRAAGANAAPDLRDLMRPVIQKNATEEQVNAAAKKVEEKADADAAVAKEVGRIATTIVGSGKLADYGTPRAQEFLKSWATKYGKSSTEKGAEKAKAGGDKDK